MRDREIHEEIRAPLMRFAVSLVGANDAADLVSEAVVATLQRRTLASIGNPQAYLMKAVLNRARSRGRRSKLEQDTLARLWVPESVGHTRDQGKQEVEAIVAGLPLQQRAAIYLVYWEDMAPAQAAKTLGVRPGTLRRYLHLAREKLRTCLNE